MSKAKVKPREATWFPGDVEYLVLYDAACTLCTRSADFLRRHDRNGKIRPVALQTPGLLAALGISPNAALGEIQVISRQSEHWVGADGVLQVLTVLPGFGWIRFFWYIPGIKSVTRRLYRYVAKHRSRVVCNDATCKL